MENSFNATITVIIFLVSFIGLVINFLLYNRKLKKQINQLQTTLLRQNSYIDELEATIGQIELAIKRKKQQIVNEKHITALKIVKQNLDEAKTHSKVGKSGHSQSNKA